jgi:hypothetical protein
VTFEVVDVICEMWAVQKSFDGTSNCLPLSLMSKQHLLPPNGVSQTTITVSVQGKPMAAPYGGFFGSTLARAPSSSFD